MEQERILNSLALLEQNINEINTAKQQVDSVVKEYGDTHKAIDKAEKTLAKVATNIQVLLDAIKEKSESLSSETTTVADDFKGATVKLVSDTKDQLSKSHKDFQKKVDTCVSELKEVTESLGYSISSLLTLRDEISEAMSSVNLIKNSLNKFSNEMTASQKSQDTQLDTIIKKVDSANEEIENTKSIVASIVKGQNKIKVICIATLLLVLMDILLLIVK